MKRYQLIISALFFIIALAAVEKINAAVFTVVNTNDSGAGSLRQAILDANVNNEDDTIAFDAAIFGTPQAIVLTSGELVVEPDNSSGTAKVLTINGTGAQMLTLNGNNNSRIFRIMMLSRAVIDGVRITGGNGTSDGTSNGINFGGGIKIDGGTNVQGAQSLILSNSLVDGNRATAIISGGGGISMFGSATIINSAIINNVAGDYGGGINMQNADLTIINSTISNNSSGLVGGIYFYGGILNLTNSTVAYNRSTVSHVTVAGIAIIEGQYTFSHFYPKNSIIAKNTGMSINGSKDVSGAYIRSRGYNIIGAVEPGLVLDDATGNQINVDPKIDPNLSLNGGGARAVPTHALRADSTAIDGGDNCVLNTTVNGGCFTTAITTDSRGVTRPQDGDGNATSTVDIGSFEATRPEVVSAPTGAPDLRAANDTGASSADNITSSSVLTFDVAGLTVGATIELLRDGVVAATTTASGNTAVLTDSGATANGVRVYSTRQIVNNTTSLQGPAISVTIDNIAPTVTLEQASWQVDPVKVQPINYSVAFSEPVAVFEPSDVSLAGSTAGISTATVAVSGSGLAYTIGVINLSGDGTVVASIPQGAVQDVAGNSNQVSTSTDNTVTYDTTRPSVTINKAADQAEPTRILPVNFTVVFSEPVTGFAAADVTITGVSGANVTVTGSGTTYNVAVSNFFTNGGFIRASVVGSAASDAAGNLSLVSTSTDNEITVDNVSPTVTINQAPGQADPTNALPVSFRIVFSEAVTGFDASDISFTGSTINTSAATVNIAGSGTTYIITVGGFTSNGGFIRASVRSAAATDALGNPSINSTSTDNQIAVDNVAPNVSINQASGQTDPASTQPINFTVVFTEPVSGFSAADVSLAGSTANVSSASVTVTGSGSVYNVAVGNITSNGQVRASLAAGAAQDSLGNSSNASTSTDNTVTVTGLVNIRPASFDYDGDGKADISVFRPSDGVWYLNRSSAGFVAFQFGIATDKLAPADYDGDGRTDLAVYRDDTWYLQRTQAGFAAYQFGQAGDIPQPGDYDGDGKAELAVFRPSDGGWYVLNLANGQFSAAQFGVNGDKPVAADFDGDGKTDYAVYRPTDGTWYMLRSQQGFTGVQFGISSDKPVVGDYNGDGKADPAVYRDGVWYQLWSGGQGFVSAQFGIATDLPAPADYDGDGKTDLAVYRDNTWYLLQSTQGFTGAQFGAAGDKPTPGAFIY